MEYLNNPWVIGIGGGILSGIIVTFITRFLFNRRDSREYFQRVGIANREVIYALRPGITQGIIPTDDAFAALINATARKYGMEKGDLYSSRQIAEELIKEILDSSFISSETKNKYCNSLSGLIREKGKPDSMQSLLIRLEQTRSEHQSRMLHTMSLTLGLTAALGTMVFTLYANNRFLDLGRDQALGFLLQVSSPTIITVAAIIMAMFASILARHAKSKVEKSHDLISTTLPNSLTIEKEREETAQ